MRPFKLYFKFFNYLLLFIFNISSDDGDNFFLVLAVMKLMMVKVILVGCVMRKRRDKVK